MYIPKPNRLNNGSLPTVLRILRTIATVSCDSNKEFLYKVINAVSMVAYIDTRDNIPGTDAKNSEPVIISLMRALV